MQNKVKQSIKSMTTFDEMLATETKIRIGWVYTAHLWSIWRVWKMMKTTTMYTESWTHGFTFLFALNLRTSWCTSLSLCPNSPCSSCKRSVDLFSFHIYTYKTTWQKYQIVKTYRASFFSKVLMSGSNGFFAWARVR